MKEDVQKAFPSVWLDVAMHIMERLGLPVRGPKLSAHLFAKIEDKGHPEDLQGDNKITKVWKSASRGGSFCRSLHGMRQNAHFRMPLDLLD